MATCKDCLFKCYTDDADRVEETCNFYLSKDKYAEVVRCKDCKWVEKGKDYEPYCNHWKSGLYANVKDEDFCSYGERKEVE